MAKVGRPTKYTKAIADKVCELLAQGKSLRKVCEEEDLPDARTIFRWLVDNKEFCQQYEQAKEQGTNAHLAIIEDLGDEAIEKAQEVDPKSSNAVVSAYKLKADNIKWVMSKMKPKKYGDKIDMTTNGKDLPTPLYGGISKKV